jgi:acetylglutamate kinase
MNINADTVAGEIAAVVEASDLVFLTDVAAVRGPGGEDIAELGLAGLDDLLTSGAVTAGMLPKLRACARAASAGVRCRIIDGRESHALRDALTGAAVGTLVTA